MQGTFTSIVAGDKTIQFLVLTLVAIISFSYPFTAAIIGFLNVPSTPINIAIRAGAVLISFWLLIAACFRRSSGLLNYGAIFLIVFWILYSIRLFYDISIKEIYFYGVKGPAYIYPYAIGNGLIPVIAVSLCAKYVKSAKINNSIIWTLLLSNILIISYLLFKGIDIQSLAWRLEIRDENKVSILNPISLARYGGALAISALSFLLFLKKTVVQTFLLVLAVIIGIINLVVGASKGPFLFFALISFFLFILYFRKARYNLAFNLKLGTVVTFLFGIFIYLFPVLSKINFGLFVRLANSDSSTGIRSSKIAHALSQFMESPVFGDQYIEEGTLEYPHNLIAESLMATGLLGTMFLFLSMVYLCYKFTLIYFKPVFYPYYFVLVYTILCYMTSNNIFEGADLWTLFAFVIGIRVKQ